MSIPEFDTLDEWQDLADACFKAVTDAGIRCSLHEEGAIRNRTRNPMTRILTFVVLATILASSALANMANPVRAGDRLGEPSGQLQQLHIEHEDLRIDLRPLAALMAAEITATYEIRNDSSARDVELVFVGVDMQRGQYSILLDGSPVAFTATHESDLPKEWQDNKDDIHDYYRRQYSSEPSETMNALRFTLYLSSGKHQIIVSYNSAVTKNVRKLTVIEWTCYYILAPAKRWASFGTLHTSVLIPHGWGETVHSEPSLRADGDSLIGDWNGVPSELLKITLHKPTGYLSSLADDFAGTLSFALLLIGVIFYGWLLGKRISKVPRPFLRNLAEIFLACIVMTIVLCALIILAPEFLVSLEAGNHVATSHFYGSFMILFVAPFIVAISMIIVAAVATASYKIAKRASVTTTA